MAPLSIAIIGAGVSGMTTAKIALEASTPSTPISIVVFEVCEHIGGLWHWRTEIEPGIGSCMTFTIVNSSKEMTAFSDFPVPASVPNFMHNKWMIKYLTAYADSFQFHRYIRFRHRVEALLPHPDQPGYLVDVRNLSTNDVTRHHFDAVAICTGHNHTPKMPDFPGLTSFSGEVVHSHAIRDVGRFRGKRVVVVGVGNSAGDIAVELAGIAEQVYLSSRRRGTWLIRRTGPNGYPIDTLVQRRLTESLLRLLPFRFRCFLVESYIRRSIGHKLLGLRPRSTRFFSQHVMVNDYLPTTIHLGQVILKPNITKVTTTGVHFEGEDPTAEETRCDVLILATGYQLSFPFLPQTTVPWSPSGSIKLYKHVFDPTQPAPERLAFIGLTQPIGSLPPIAEIQARWFIGLLVGSCAPLPPPSQMYKEIERRRVHIRARYGAENEARYTFQADWLPYMDSIAKSAGVAPQLMRYLFTEPSLWWALVINRPAISAQYRLNGPGAKGALAKEMIFGIKERIKYPYRGCS